MKWNLTFLNDIKHKHLNTNITAVSSAVRKTATFPQRNCLIIALSFYSIFWDSWLYKVNICRKHGGGHGLFSFAHWVLRSQNYLV